MEDLGYDGRSLMYYHFLRPYTILDYGLQALGSDIDVINLSQYVNRYKEIVVYTEHEQTKARTYSNVSPSSKVVIQELESDVPSTSKSVRASRPKKQLLLEFGDQSSHKSVIEQVEQCTYKYLSSQLVEPLEKNTKIPPKAVKAQFEKDLELDTSKMKTYMALKKATTIIQEDFKEQYAILKDYIDELMRANLDTIVRVETEPGNPKASQRVFKSICVCLGPLKKGFKTLTRDLLGVDEAHMKDPATGHILTAVGVDCNNGIYHVAYAIVQSENYKSWIWFLQCLGEDLDLDRNLNFTFMSDRQKCLLQAITQLYPCAEHTYCLKHIHENMKLKWRGTAFKLLLWKCASATTFPHFEKAMLELKTFSEPCYTWLSKIPPQHWARSHFSGRAVSDVLLNNMCEVLNRWLLDGRDKPIITIVEYTREYLMKSVTPRQTVITINQ